MRSVGWLDHPDFDLHSNGPGHPERPERLHAIRRGLAGNELQAHLTRLRAQPVERALLESVHTPRYVAQIEALSAAGGGPLDADTSVGPETWRVALLAAGAVAEAVQRVLSGEWQRAFCSVRPPGHHACSDAGMGFCIFDNVAVGAAVAIATGQVKRVAIIDWDVHHGNGTEEIFRERDDVFFASSHQFPLYPGTGLTSLSETSLNCPLPPGAGDDEVVEAWQNLVGPKLEAFAPELLLISAGFDADARDPLAQLQVTPNGFARLTALASTWADKCCAGRLVSVLEGGYDLDALSEGVAAHVRGLLADP